MAVPASARRRPPVSLVRPYGTSPKTRPDMRNNADNHNASHPNLAGKCPDRPQFSALFPGENPNPLESSAKSRSPTVTA